MKTITRILPRGDDDRWSALDKASRKKSITPPASMPLTNATQTKLDNAYAEFTLLLKDYAGAAAGKSKMTTLSEKAKIKAKMFVSHYIQAFNNGVDRGLFQRGDRGFYGLEVSSNSVPELFSTEKIKFWAERVIRGDARRVAAGGVAMSNPSADEVAETYNDFVYYNNQLSLLKSEFKKAEQAVKKLRKPVDIAIKKVWDEVESFYSELPAAYSRSRSRTWGIYYQPETIVVINANVINKETGKLISNAVIKVLQSRTKYTTNRAGTAIIKTKVKKKVTLQTIVPGFEPSEQVVNFKKKVFKYSETIELVPVVVVNE